MQFKKTLFSIALLLVFLPPNSYSQQHLLPVKKVIGSVKDEPFETDKWTAVHNNGVVKQKDGVLKIQCNPGERQVYKLEQQYFSPAQNYTIEFKLKVPYNSINGRGLDIGIYDGLKALDVNITENQITDYGIKKVLTDGLDFKSAFKTIRFTVERFVGIVHLYIDEKYTTSYILRKPTSEKYIRIGKENSSASTNIEISSVKIDYTGAYRPN